MAQRGRPEFKPTRTQRREVEQLAACGMSQEEIAAAIGISPPTLQKHFATELLVARARKRAEVIKLLFKSARHGNVSAQKKLEAMTGAPDASPAAAKLGKKEQAAVAAQTPDVGTPIGELMARRAADPSKLH